MVQLPQTPMRTVRTKGKSFSELREHTMGNLSVTTPSHDNLKRLARVMCASQASGSTLLKSVVTDFWGVVTALGPRSGMAPEGHDILTQRSDAG